MRAANCNSCASLAGIVLSFYCMFYFICDCSLSHHPQWLLGLTAVTSLNRYRTGHCRCKYPGGLRSRRFTLLMKVQSNGFKNSAYTLNKKINNTTLNISNWTPKSSQILTPYNRLIGLPLTWFILTSTANTTSNTTVYLELSRSAKSSSFCDRVWGAFDTTPTILSMPG